jgi:hypothetical protein
VTIYLPNRQPIVQESHEEVKGLKLLPEFYCKVADFFVMPGEKLSKRGYLPGRQQCSEFARL